MCGVAGLLHLDGAPASPVLLRRMTDAIAHRGPDGEGFFCDGPLGLGHRRLAILDTTPAGHQPMMSRDKRFILSYNGEIYNFQELRLELEQAGFAFHSRSDSEVVLNAFAHWGEAALDRFNGIFAFAIWDAQARQLFLARDRYGNKPLYYTLQGQTLLFGSEVKAILAHGAYRADMDREALLEYFTFQNFFTDRTLFKGVKLLPAGHFMRIGANLTPQLQFRQYWDFDFRESHRANSREETLEEFHRLFQQAVNRQLISDVEVGGYLSGGIDSGSIIAVASRQLPEMKTFTCGMDIHSASGLELGFDEREKAEYMSYLFGTEHYEMVLKAGDMERCLPALTWHLEEPRVGQSYPNFYIARLAGKFVKVVLAGAGSDELFGGYPWRYFRANDARNFEEFVDSYYLFWQRLIPNRLIKRAFAPIQRDVADVWTRDIFKDVFRIGQRDFPLERPEDYVNHSLYLEAKTFLHGLLVVEDKLSMAHGLEARTPFLDNDLVDFAMAMPVGLKLANLGEVMRLNENEPGPKGPRFYQQSHDGKLIVREAMTRYAPEAISNAVKQGFSAPDASWFRGDSMDYVRRVVFDDRALIYDFLDRRTVRELVEEHLSGKVNRRLLIWSLLNVEQWCRTFLEGSGSGPPAGAS